MTTLVGIVVKKGTEGVILSSDLSSTQTNWVPHGDVAYKQQTREDAQKIYCDDSGNLAISMTGIFDTPYSEFEQAIRKGEIDIMKAIEIGFFEDLLKLNLSRWGEKVPNDAMNSLLIATRFEGKPKLYTCFPLGAVKERNWTSIGSGSQYALEKLSRHAEDIPEYTTLAEGIDLVTDCIERASKDIYTGGLDLVVVTKDKIRSFGDVVKNSMERAKRDSIDQIKSQLTG